VPNGVELPDGVRAANGSTGRNRVVGTLSLLEPVKDVSTFLTAASLLAPDHPDLQFVVFGDGPERAPLIERAHELGIADRVTFPGYVDRDVAFRRLDVFVLPSIIENSPMVLLEAMARGVPVVASRSGGIPEITAGDTALLAEPGDAPAFAKAIARLLYDREFANRLAAAALARIAAKYTSSRNADAMIKIYEAALDRRRCR
jgi:glycosyltransferase involved in cell wall biosynthesis